MIAIISTPIKTKKLLGELIREKANEKYQSIPINAIKSTGIFIQKYRFNSLKTLFILSFPYQTCQSIGALPCAISSSLALAK